MCIVAFAIAECGLIAFFWPINPSTIGHDSRCNSVAAEILRQEKLQAAFRANKEISQNKRLDARDMKLSFSLASAKPKPVPIGLAPSDKKPPAFVALGEDALDSVDAAPTASDNKQASANKKLLARNVGMSRIMQKRMDAERQVDATVFEYDEVYDKMQEAKERQKLAKEAESRERKASRCLLL
jgi:hypothetical protein